jgi:poly-gamma-glutamate capsule biosynthesis protein CapA/YwtB (metallophosphatase superfamily)
VVNGIVGRVVAAGGLALLVLAAACTDAPPQDHQASAGPTAAVPGPSSQSGPRTITILGAGDVLLHQPLWTQAAARAKGTSGYDFEPVFAAVKPDVSAADLAVCHMETPLGRAAGPFTSWPTFQVPPQVATAIAHTGFDTCSTASNHSLDAGEQGVDRTLDTLDATGLKHAGTYRSAKAQRVPNIVDVHGVKVAQLSYTFGFNGLQRPAGRNWIANLIDPAAIIAEARRARAAGAQIVVVCLHWGTEYDHGANADQVQLARQLLAAGEIDLILGCHAHVVQPFEKIGDKWVAYGMGNEIARHSDPVDATREGVMPRFTFTEVAAGRWRITRAEAIPTWVDFTPDIHLVDLPAALADPATTPAQRKIYQAARTRIAGYVLARHADVTVLG